MTSLAKENLISLNSNLISESFLKRKNVNKARQEVATILQLKYIIFKISEIRVAVYNEKEEFFDIEYLKDLIEEIIFPAVANEQDIKYIIKYFEFIPEYRIKRFNDIEIEELDTIPPDLERTVFNIDLVKIKRDKLRGAYSWKN